MHREWFEPALARHLDRVAAPADLWERIQSPKRKTGVHRSVNAARIGACATILLLVGWFYLGQRGIRSGDAGEVRAWVLAKAGVDVPLRGRHAGLQVTGASVGKGSVEIAYRVGPRDGRLLVAKGGSGGGRHSMPSGARVFTWSMDGHTYTLACATPEDLRIACSLCHIG
jgi:hypothetical protein